MQPNSLVKLAGLRVGIQSWNLPNAVQSANPRDQDTAVGPMVIILNK
jgi:hypothetical protein